MRFHAWLIAIASFTVASSAWPQLPHFTLEQAGTTDGVSAQQSVKGACKRIAQLSYLSKLASNQTLCDTLLADKKISQDQIDYVQSETDTINAELDGLTSNTTLTTECGSIDAHRKAVKDCRRLDKLEKLVELANNKTAYDEHLAGEVLNQKQTEQLNKNMETAAIKLQELRSNSTLIELCTNEIGLQQNGAAGQVAGDIGKGAYIMLLARQT